MTSNIGQSKFYQTFASFLTEKTTTAEKTMQGRDVMQKKTAPILPREFYTTVATGGLLLIPMLAIGLSRQSVKSMAKQANQNLEMDGTKNL